MPNHTTSYVTPLAKRPLSVTENGLVADDDTFYPFLSLDGISHEIPNFVQLDVISEQGRVSVDMYNQEKSVEIYGNFLNWLFQTFDQDETIFRQNMIDRLSLEDGHKVLITGCGLGDDLRPILDKFGDKCQIYALDLAAEMVAFAAQSISAAYPDAVKTVHFSVCDAADLPFSDGFFNASFHFGGINLFDDVKGAIWEMTRVVSEGGRVCFGDESVAPWLRDTDYGKMAILNNGLWEALPPLMDLPFSATDPTHSWVLGNCFYVIDYTVRVAGPHMNPDIPHKGIRGGSMGTRYRGQLEGVTKESRDFVYENAKAEGISAYKWLENLIAEKKRG